MWAKIFSSFFPVSLRGESFVLSLIFTLMLYVVRFLILQMPNVNEILNTIIIYFCAAAILNLISATRGPLANGSIPIIYYNILGSWLYVGSAPALLTASVFIFYGGVTLVCSVLTAGFIELLYNRVARRLPSSMVRILTVVDSQVNSDASIASFKLFYDHGWEGSVATLAVLLVYAVLFCITALHK